MTTRGDRLQEARKKAGYPSALKAARALGVPSASYSAHERAEKPGGRDYGAKDAMKYAAAFGVTPEHLTYGTTVNGGPTPNTPPVRDSLRDEIDRIIRKAVDDTLHAVANSLEKRR